MIIIEIIVVCFALFTIWTIGRLILKSLAFRRMREQTRNETLRLALRSNDHRLVSDWLILYGKDVDDTTRTLIEARRDQMFIDSNS